MPTEPRTSPTSPASMRTPRTLCSESFKGRLLASRLSCSLRGRPPLPQGLLSRSASVHSIHLFIRSFIHSFIHSFLHSFIHSSLLFTFAQQNQSLASIPPPPRLVVQMGFWVEPCLFISQDLSLCYIRMVLKHVASTHLTRMLSTDCFKYTQDSPCRALSHPSRAGKYHSVTVTSIPGCDQAACR